MNRLDLISIAVVAAMAGFVGHEVFDARREQPPRAGALGAAARVTSTAGALAMRTASIGRLAAPVPPARDMAEVRRRLQRGAPGTYISELLFFRDSSLARWPERRAQPLRVWVQTWSDLPDWDPEFPGLVRGAFQAWEGTGIPLSFSFVRDSASAEVHVTWTDRFDEEISGKTVWAHDDKWWIVEANIVLALHHHTGDVLEPAAVRAIALHEVGHLIGLDHTADPSNIMTPRIRVRELSAADRATAQLLYMLPPGTVR